MESITDLTPDQLQKITPDSYTSELIRALVGHSVPTSSIDIECQNLTQHLFNEAKDNHLCQNRQLSNIFATPINAFKHHQADVVKSTP